jgi:hypothetical protein
MHELITLEKTVAQTPSIGKRGTLIAFPQQYPEEDSHEPIEISARKALPTEYLHLADIPQVRFYDVRGSTSIRRKADVFGLATSQIMKTYVMESRGGRYYMAVVPGDREVDVALCDKYASAAISRRIHDLKDRGTRVSWHRLSLRKARTLPKPMTYGSCGPFLRPEDIPDASAHKLAKPGQVQGIFVEYVGSGEYLVDFAVPGRSGISMQAKLSDMADFLGSASDGKRTLLGFGKVSKAQEYDAMKRYVSGAV